MSNVYCAVYSIRNKINGKQYIGSSIMPSNRFAGHRQGLRKNKHPNPYLQAAWNKYGEENFEFTIVEHVNLKQNLEVREQYWLDFHKSYNAINGYNICSKAYRKTGVTPWNKGKSWSKAMREKIGDAKRGTRMSDETKKKISLTSIGKPHSVEHNRRIRETKRKNLIGTYIECTQCNKRFYRMPAFMAKIHNFCSRQCSVLWQGLPGNNPNPTGINQFTKDDKD